MSDNADETRQYPRTYLEASDSAHNIVEAQKRYEELTQRELSARTVAKLRADGEFDPDRLGHQELAKSAPLTVGEHLEMLAAGEVMARYYRHPADVHRAAEAGASFEEIAAARGTTADRERTKYRAWATTQHDMNAGLGSWEGDPRPGWGISDADYAAAMGRASHPAPERGPLNSPGLDQAAGADREAGQ